MTPSAIIFGSIGTLVETSEMQRESFNRAFADAGLDWNWDRASYRTMLATPGGADRIAAYAEQKGEQVDADALHANKTALFDKAMRDQGLELRPGVDEVLDWAERNEVPVAIASTTSRANLDAMMDAVAGLVSRISFVADGSMVAKNKPDPEVYRLVCERLEVQPSRCIGIEDSEANLAAPLSIGLKTIAFPGANTANQNYEAAASIAERLDPDAFDTL